MTFSLDAPGEPATILIVDHDPLNRQLLEVMLLPEGFRLLTAASGEAALSLVARDPPDLILLDFLMPDIDGPAVAARIKGNPATSNIPVIIVTALDDHDARMRALSSGAEDFLPKPVNRAELSARVRNLLRLKAYSDYHDRYSQMLEGEVGSRRVDLIDSERLYRSTFDAAPVGIVHVGLDGRWLGVNQRLCDLLGYACAELHGCMPQEFLQTEDTDEERGALLQMAAGAADRHVVDEKRYRRRDGTLMFAKVHISVHRDAARRARNFTYVIEDITGQRALEAQVRQAGKMDAIGRLASGVAHDFNNLLTVILGFAEMVSKDPAMTKEHGTDLGEIVRAAERAAALTKQLLAFSRQQVLHTEPLDLNALIQNMTGMLGRLIGEQIDVTLSLAADLPLALADRSQIEQVVMNLVVNARDAMPDGGRITIETADIELENSTFHDETVMSGRFVMFSVTDTGSGMTPDTRRRLFEPFFTTKETGKGTGLGLSTTYGIVKQSKGYIWVYSELGLGSTFKVYIPRADRGGVPEPLALPEPEVVAGRTKTVLLVEDEPGVRRLTRRILGKAGYEVLEAANGDEAEQIFARRAGAIDLVVTDVVMPGCGGPELLARLQAKAPALRVLYVSGYTEQSAFQNFSIADVPFLQKPFTAAALLRNIRIALDGEERA